MIIKHDQQIRGAQRFVGFIIIIIIFIMFQANFDQCLFQFHGQPAAWSDRTFFSLFAKLIGRDAPFRRHFLLFFVVMNEGVAGRNGRETSFHEGYEHRVNSTFLAHKNNQNKNN